HVYASTSTIGFDHLSWLFSADVLRLSAKDDGTAPDPGVRFGTSWDERPHRKRIIRVTADVLAQWQCLVGDVDQTVDEARLLSPVSTAEASAIEALAAYPLRLGSLAPQVSRGFEESGAKEVGLIGYNIADSGDNASVPETWDEVILKGPQLSVANPMFK